MNAKKCEIFTLEGKDHKSIEVPIIGYKSFTNLPILDMPMMSDEKWNELTKRNPR